MSKHDGKYWDESWNPLKAKDCGGRKLHSQENSERWDGYHCTKCSPGCQKCWAEGVNLRAGGRPYGAQRSPGGSDIGAAEISRGDETPIEYVISENVLAGKVTHPKPATFFVCDLCDLFHPDVPDDLIARIIRKIEMLSHHKYLLLTKRPSRAQRMFGGSHPLFTDYTGLSGHIWLGASICVRDEKSKIDELRNTQASNRWLSFGPLLEPMGQINLTGIDWVVIEEESDGWRPGRPSYEGGNGWFYAVKPIVEQCRDAKIPCWVKQVHKNGGLVKRTEELPVDVRVRQWPAGMTVEMVNSGAGEGMPNVK